MQKLIIADTSCLILLDNIDELEILHKLYGEIFITSIISEEFGVEIPKWFKVLNPKNNEYKKILATNVDPGEASAIALGLEMPRSTLILDDHKARTLAKQLHLRFTGTMGVLLEAKQQGLILSMKGILAKISTTNFRLSKEIESKILHKAGEI